MTSEAMDSVDEFEKITTNVNDETGDILLYCERSGCPAPELVSGLSSPSLRSFIVRAVSHNEKWH